MADESFPQGNPDEQLPAEQLDGQQPPQEGQPDGKAAPEDQTPSAEQTQTDTPIPPETPGEVVEPVSPAFHESVGTPESEEKSDKPTEMVEGQGHDVEEPNDKTQLREGEKGRIRNKVKSEVMAHAQNAALDRGEKFPENAAIHADIEYDMDVAKGKVKSSEPNKQEKVDSLRKVEQYDMQKRNQILKYSHAIVEHYKQTGDKPSPSLAALAAVYELVQNAGYSDFELSERGLTELESNVRVTFDKYERVVVESGDDQVSQYEKFTLTMFHGSGYEVTTSQVDWEDFDEVLTTKKRYLKSEDVDKLKEILAPCIAERAKEEQELEDANQEEEERQYQDHRDDYEKDDDYVSSTEIVARARAHFGGDTEEAREAARLYPGDFM